jgi:hypothetical protein
MSTKRAGNPSLGCVLVQLADKDAQSLLEILSVPKILNLRAVVATAAWPRSSTSGTRTRPLETASARSHGLDL